MPPGGGMIPVGGSYKANDAVPTVSGLVIFCFLQGTKTKVLFLSSNKKCS